MTDLSAGGAESLVLAYLRLKAGWQLMFELRLTMIREGSEHPGRPLHPWNFEPAAADAVRRTTVPAGKNDEQAPAPLPLPLTITQLIPAGCDVIVPLPLLPGMIETLPWLKADWV